MVSVGQRKSNRLCVCAVAASLCVGAGAFFAASPASTTPGRAPLGATSSRAMTRLKGVREWKEGQPGELREIGFLPFPVDDVMCPGETKALHLYEARFLSLFENAIKNHGGCVGGAIFVDDGVLVRVGQLCDIVAWEREEVGVSVALRCVGRCEIRDVTNSDPYIFATVREVRDMVGMDELDEEGEGNNVVSSNVFSLHRQCVELEGKMATAAGGNIGWETGMGGKVSGRKGGANPGQSGSWTVFDDDDNDDDNDDDDSDTEDHDELFGESGSAAFDRTSGEGGAEADDLMAKFQWGGGELDLSQLESGGRSDNAEGDGKTQSSAAAAGGMVEDTATRGRSRESALDGRRGSSVDSFAAEDDEDDEDDDEDEEEDEEGGWREKGVGDLLWGHETYESDGFDSSLEEQVEAMYDSLKADLSVSLEETRGGVDAAAFGAPNKNAEDRPWGVSGAGGPTTIADVIAAATSAGGSLAPGGGEGHYLWGCSSPQEEREQLVSFVSLGCFDPSARLQSLMLLSTGERLRMARDALAERLKVLVAKSALSQLGE